MTGKKWHSKSFLFPPATCTLWLVCGSDWIRSVAITLVYILWPLICILVLSFFRLFVCLFPTNSCSHSFHFHWMQFTLGALEYFALHEIRFNFFAYLFIYSLTILTWFISHLYSAVRYGRAFICVKMKKRTRKMKIILIVMNRVGN